MESVIFEKRREFNLIVITGLLKSTKYLRFSFRNKETQIYWVLNENKFFQRVFSLPHYLKLINSALRGYFDFKNMYLYLKIIRFLPCFNVTFRVIKQYEANIVCVGYILANIDNNDMNY